MHAIIVWALIGYLLGSIPFGLVLTQLFGGLDLRSIGSGNIGATNVLRTGRKDLAVATLLLDALKATVAVLFAARWGGQGSALAAAGGAFIGHLYPIWLRFNGGKGVATMIGALIGLWWPAALAFCALWLATAFSTRYSSLAALVASLAPGPLFLAVGRPAAAMLSVAMTCLLWIKHRKNIARLRAGAETKIGASS